MLNIDFGYNNYLPQDGIGTLCEIIANVVCDNSELLSPFEGESQLLSGQKDTCTCHYRGQELCHTNI